MWLIYISYLEYAHLFVSLFMALSLFEEFGVVFCRISHILNLSDCLLILNLSYCFLMSTLNINSGNTP